MLEARGVCTPRVRDVSFRLHAGETPGFSGLVGVGRTEAIRGVLGFDPILSGEVLLARRTLAGPPPAGRPLPRVLLVSPIHIGRAYLVREQMHAMFGEGAVERSEGIAAALRAVAGRQQCALVDAAAICEPSGLDGIHLELENSRRLAEALRGAIRDGPA